MILPNTTTFKYKNNWHHQPMFSYVPASSLNTTAKTINNLPIGMTHTLPDFPVIAKKSKSRKYYPSVMRGKTWRKRK